VCSSDLETLGLTDELALQLEIAKYDYELYKNKFPEDGKITAADSGIITAVNISAGETSLPNMNIIDTKTPEAVPCLSFVLPEEYGNVFKTGDTVIQYFSSPCESIISNKKYNPSINNFIYYSEVNIIKENGVYPGEFIPVKVINDTEIYALVLPLSAVYSGIQGMNTVFVVKTRAGLFGEEYYVKSVPVDIIKQNDYYIAVNNSDIEPDDFIVTASSEPLLSGETVRFSAS
jgi:hypothetical protein